MKRKSSIVTEEENRLSKLLFNKPDEFIDKLKTDASEIISAVDRKPAWIDEDDNEFEANIIPHSTAKGLYKDSLKTKYENLIGTPNWARLDYKPEKGDDDEILRSVGHLQKTKSDKLRKDFLDVKKLPMIGVEDRQIITCLEFHPTASVALVGGHFGKFSLSSVGKTNNKLHSFILQKFKAGNAYFTPDGNEAYITSKNNKTYCIYDLIKAEAKLQELPHKMKRANIFVLSPNGKYIAIVEGYDEVCIVSAASKEVLNMLKHNNDVESLAFSHDSQKLYSYCKEGQVCVWDLSMYRVVKKFYDQGCITPSCIAMSPCGQLLAAGSGEGIVNIYETSKLNVQDPIPVKVVQNLKTRISSLKFNSASEILSVSSSTKPDALRLVHIPSYHVFINFPPNSSTLSKVECVNFSPNSGYMAVGNDVGSAYLYRLKHYENY